MSQNPLSDEQWLILDLLMRARQKGVHRLSRMELLSAAQVPQDVRMRLTWAALTMPKDLVEWVGQHDFSITDCGVATYDFRFGKKPTDIADSVISLPGPEHYTN